MTASYPPEYGTGPFVHLTPMLGVSKHAVEGAMAAEHERMIQGESEAKEEAIERHDRADSEPDPDMPDDEGERARPDPTDPNAAAFPTEYDEEREQEYLGTADLGDADRPPDGEGE